MEKIDTDFKQQNCKVYLNFSNPFDHDVASLITTCKLKVGRERKSNLRREALSLIKMERREGN